MKLKIIITGKTQTLRYEILKKTIIEVVETNISLSGDRAIIFSL